MKKIIFFIFLLAYTITYTQAQVGINTTIPDTSAMLDIVSTDKGLLIPRMSTAQKIAIADPATSLLVYDTTLRQLQQNAGTSASPQWVPLVVRDSKNSFFYMPSVSIDASAIVTNQSLDLYSEYKKQFTGADATTFKSSIGAPTQIPYFPAATNLYYYITHYDNTTVQINSINANGVVNYDILKESDYDAFMNVVFVVKPS